MSYFKLQTSEMEANLIDQPLKFQMSRREEEKKMGLASCQVKSMYLAALIVNA